MNSQSTSRPRTRLLMWLAVCSLLCQPMQLLGAAAPHKASATLKSGDKSVNADLSRQRENFGNLPLSFEANRGQAGEEVKFIARQREFTLALTPAGVMLGPIKMQFAGANVNQRLSGLNPLPGKSHYFLGNDPRLWRADVPTYGKVEYKNLYPGIDLLFYGDQKQVEYDFILAPGANPNPIKLNFRGAKNIRLDDQGNLILKTQTGELRQHKPFAYQEVGDVKREVASRFVLDGQTVKFALGAYDTTKPLVIDPVLSYSTLLGGSLLDTPEAMAVDAQGNVYVTGSTYYRNLRGTGADFPSTTGAIKSNGTPPVDEGTYVFVSKLNPTGTALIYSAIIGGTKGFPDFPIPSLANFAYGIAVDEAGAAYVTGFTNSLNFPTTSGVIQPTTASQYLIDEAFVFKLNPTGSALSYSTLLGQGDAGGRAIAVDHAGQVWVTGYARHRFFPTTPDAWQPKPLGASQTGFVSKLNSTADRILYASYLSSGGADAPSGIALDAAGAAYVTGTTSSSCLRADLPAVAPFPTTDGAFQRDPGTGCVSGAATSYVFVTKFAADGAVVYSTLIRGASGNAIAADSTGAAYVAGKRAGGLSFPVTPGAFQTEPPAGLLSQSGIVTKLNSTGSGLVYSTYFSGSVGLFGNLKMAVDGQGRACLTGAVSDSTFVATTQDAPFGARRGAFVTRFNAAGSALDYSVVLGDTYTGGRGIAVGLNEDVYVTGTTSYAGFPVTPNAYQQQPAGDNDVFLLKLSPTRPVTSVSAASYVGTTLASDSIVAAFGQEMTSATMVADATPLPTTLAGLTVKLRDALGAEHFAPLFFISPNQVNYLVPPEAASGAATVTVMKDGIAVSGGNIQIAPVAPGLFTADSSGRGLPTALALYVKPDGSQRYAPVAQFDAARSTFAAMPIEACSNGEEAYLILFGTGLRRRSSMAAVSVKLAGIDAPVIYAGEQGGFAGLDQINVQLPRSLCGRGEIDLKLTVDGTPANPVKVVIK